MIIENGILNPPKYLQACSHDILYVHTVGSGYMSSSVVYISTCICTTCNISMCMYIIIYTIHMAQ